MKLVSFIATVATLFMVTASAQASPGELDRSFGDRGHVRISVSPGEKPVLRDMVRDPDGKLLLSGGGAEQEHGFLLRLLPDGTPDPSFGGGDGLVLTPSSLWAKLDFQGERIVAFGRSGTEPAIARFDSDGSLDESFGEAGIRQLEVRSLFRENAAPVIESPGPGVDSQGRIVAGVMPLDCSTEEVEGRGRHSCGNTILLRLDDNGDIEPDFGTNGSLILAAGLDSGGRPTTLAFDRQDRILVRTRDQIFYGEPQPTRDDVLQRFDLSGAYDREFGEDGMVKLGVWSGEGGQTNRGRIIEDSAGSLFVAANFFRKVTDGGEVSKRPSYGDPRDISDGSFLSSTDVEFDPKGRMIVSGTANMKKGRRQFVVSRFETDGFPDDTWTSDGVTTAGLGKRLSYKLMKRRRGIIEAASVLEPDGGVTVAATAVDGGRFTVEIVRFSGGDGTHQYCHGRRATVQGTPGDDRLRSGYESVIAAGAGDDVIRGEGEMFCLGSGDDVVLGGDYGYGPTPLILGGAGNDRIRSTGTIYSGPGSDRVDAGSRTSVFAGPGADRITAGDQTEVEGGLGADRISGSSRGRLDGGPGPDHLSLASGGHLLGRAGDDVLIGSPVEDLLDGGPGNDRLEGDGRRDRLYGRAGNDRLDGGSGPDLLVGGRGRDRVIPGPPVARRQVYSIDNRTARGRVWMNGNRWSAGDLGIWYRCAGWASGPVNDGFHSSSTFNEDLKFNRGRAFVPFEESDGFGFSASGWMRAKKTPRKITVTYVGSEDFSYGDDGAFECDTGRLHFTLHRVAGDRDVIRP